MPELCRDAPLEEPTLIKRDAELNRLTHKQLNAERDVDNIISERDYVLGALHGCKYILPKDLESIKQNYANNLEDAQGELNFINGKIHDLIYGG